MYSSYGGKTEIEAWQSLVHVCRRWRSLVLGSPRRLNLRLFCTPETPAKDTLGVWPALPLIVVGNMALSSGTDNVISALGQGNRVREVFLRGLADWQLEKVLAAMQVPFPELTDLQLSSERETLQVIPDSFLGGSAPRLRYFDLSGIPFPGLPKLLLSADHLAYLWLSNIPHSGYFSPEAMAALLCALSNLKAFSLRFQSPRSHPNLESRSLPPLKRSILPALDEFYFKGVIEYLEDLTTFIGAPQLNTLQISLFNQIDFDCPRLAQFINHSPKLRKLDAGLQFHDMGPRVALPARSRVLEIEILCREPDWQLSSVEQVCNSSLYPLSMVEDLYIVNRYSNLVWKNGIVENTLWLRLLLPFTAVQTLNIAKEFVPDIAAALRELVGARLTEVLPSLQNIYLQAVESLELFQENVGQFIAARQLSGRPINMRVSM
jgi:hypothetical protein